MLVRSTLVIPVEARLRAGRAAGTMARVAVNLASLFAFKYTVFRAGAIAELLARPVPPISISLPIGISGQF